MRNMFNYIKDLIRVGRFNRPGNKMSPEYITIHDTANTSPGANALMHARYLKTVTKEVSWHYTVDDTTVVQHLLWNEVGWHAGNSQGNGNSIGIEICMNSDGNRAKAEENAQLLCVDLMKETGIQLDHIVQHNHWNGKNCPQVLRARANGWQQFIEGIYNIIHPPVAPVQAPEGKLFKVQVGAYKYLAGAEELLAQLKAKGFAGFIKVE